MHILWASRTLYSLDCRILSINVYCLFGIKGFSRGLLIMVEALFFDLLLHKENFVNLRIPIFPLIGNIRRNCLSLVYVLEVQILQAIGSYWACNVSHKKQVFFWISPTFNHADVFYFLLSLLLLLLADIDRFSMLIRILPRPPRVKARIARADRALAALSHRHYGMEVGHALIVGSRMQAGFLIFRSIFSALSRGLASLTILRLSARRLNHGEHVCVGDVHPRWVWLIGQSSFDFLSR